MRQILALSLGLSLIAGCAPKASTPGTPTATTTTAGSTSALNLSSSQQASYDSLSQETAEIAVLYSDLEQGEKQADSDLSTASFQVAQDASPSPEVVASAEVTVTASPEASASPTAAATAAPAVSVSFSSSRSAERIVNADGSITRKLYLSRTGRKGFTREMTVESTRNKGKLLSRVITLDVTGPKGGNRHVVRNVTVADDGARTVTTSFSMTLADGKQRTVQLTRTRSSGVVTESGTLTRFNGTVINFTLTRQLSGDVQVTATDNGVAVTVEASASGDASVEKVEANGATAENVAVETEV